MGFLEVVVQLVVIVATLEAATGQVALPGCQDKCGNISIPYPFGIGGGCYLEDAFSLVCREPNKPLVWASSLRVLNVSLEGHLRVSMKASYDCYNREGSNSYNRESSNSLGISFSFSRFAVSDIQNKLMGVGCDSDSILQSPYTDEGLSYCRTKCSSPSDGSCDGEGCCQASVPRHVNKFRLLVASTSSSFYRTAEPYRCNYAFLVEKDGYNFTSLDLSITNKTREFPVVLEWWIGQTSCNEAKQNMGSYACKSQNSFCIDSDGGPGYQCKCPNGYTGNPYLPNDIDECKDLNLNDCLAPENCRNLKGSYTCFCHKGYHGDGRRDGKGCLAYQTSWKDILVGVLISLLLFSSAICLLIWALWKRKIIKRREKFFERNGGFLLQRQLPKLNRTSEQTRLFSAKDLEKATENYHESRILGQGGQGTVYKGIFPGNRMVAIKRATIGDRNQVGEFINELIVLSQINHRNVVKLLGFCLETEVPLLVYEFVPKGSLFDRLHDPSQPSALPWENRLKIAVETAGALSYLHSAASIPIIHRDIKSANILLDDNYTAKLSDFGTSRLIPSDQEQLTTLVRGTLGYLDPEYFHTSHLTEKSDVYSFGVVLMELLTGEKALSFARTETERHLVMSFTSAVKESRLVEILDQRAGNAGNFEELQGVANLATRCVSLKGDERPTMKEVAVELEGLRAIEKQPWVQVKYHTVMLLAK